ncbi:hypothetical protein TNCV_3318971 [Trichonephila clavipes]|nr:hypothetical protein TNCV_3318971 [Trichonephila clavipes]
MLCNSISVQPQSLNRRFPPPTLSDSTRAQIRVRWPRLIILAASAVLKIRFQQDGATCHTKLCHNRFIEHRRDSMFDSELGSYPVYRQNDLGYGNIEFEDSHKRPDNHFQDMEHLLPAIADMSQMLKSHQYDT